MTVSTHILDTAKGRPAAGVKVVIERKELSGFTPIASAVTDDDGRVKQLLSANQSTAGEYRATFDVGAYFANHGDKSFYPEVHVIFTIEAPAEHYHVPLLLSPFGYSTYRGS
jgi:5-hydroxyisourate hydrolase